MHITLLAVGTRGDVQPYIALGRGLKAAGHRIRLATHPQFENFVEEYELEFFALRGNPQEILQGDVAQALMNGSPDAIRYLGIFVQMGRELMDQLHADIWKACQGTKAIVYAPLAIAGHYAAKKLNIPRLGAALQPLSRTWTHPSIFMPRWLRFGIPFNYLSHIFVEQMLWQPTRSRVNRWLSQDLEMEPLPFKGPFSEIYHSDTPLIFGISQHVYPRPRDWPKHHYLTGYWFLEPVSKWKPPAELVDFLDDGTPPVYVGFGSMPHKRADDTVEIVLEALKLSEHRGLLLKGWGGLSASDLPREVFMLDSAPHDWLFPRMAAVVHHGGAGTTAAGLRAGIPSVLIPHITDQPFWSERVRALGVGPPAMKWRKLDARRLAGAIRLAVEDMPMRVRSEQLGKKLQSEDGISKAVRIIEAHIR
jgi:UDP:flavonoid glycosyltransferase YjiC (YdhE family)